MASCPGACDGLATRATVKRAPRSVTSARVPFALADPDDVRGQDSSVDGIRVRQGRDRSIDPASATWLASGHSRLVRVVFGLQAPAAIALLGTLEEKISLPTQEGEPSREKGVGSDAFDIIRLVHGRLSEGGCDGFDTGNSFRHREEREATTRSSFGPRRRSALRRDGSPLRCDPRPHAAIFRSLIAPKSCTPPPTRFVT